MYAQINLRYSGDTIILTMNMEIMLKAVGSNQELY